MLSSTLQCDSYLANSIVQHLETKGLLQATRDEGVFLVERSAKSEAFVASQLGKSEFTYYQDADATTELRHKSNNQDGEAPPRRRLAQLNRPSGRGLETAFNSLSCAASLSQVAGTACIQLARCANQPCAYALPDQQCGEHLGSQVL